MSLFTIESQTLLQDVPPSPIETEDDYFSSERTYTIIKNGETKYRLYFYEDATFFQLTSEDNNHLIQTGDLDHKYRGSFFDLETDDGILERKYLGPKGLKQNELVVNGKDLFLPFKVEGLADMIEVYIVREQAREQAMSDAEQKQIDANTSINLRF